MIVNHDLPQGEELNVDLEIFKVQNMSSKYRLAQRVTTGSKSTPNALVAEIYAVILKNPKSILKKAQKPKTYDTENLTLVKTKHIAKRDAQSYAYLSGDVNPIHLSQRIAKLMGLKGSIMHGAGLFAIIYETFKNLGIKVTEIDIRFLSPVYLNSTICIYSEELKNGKTAIKVISEDKNTVHINGEFTAS